ncbi:MAG: hypothetical protein EU530_04695 [Promethearchaeota archaeon]|nr:MAG: hypothetical protein EU530_04695 [Candidatus Lokiarchaeota archaeon]
MKKWGKIVLLLFSAGLLFVTIYFPVMWYVVYPRQGVYLDKPINQLEEGEVEGRYFPLPARPTELYSINQDDCEGESLVTLLTLQGLLAQRENGTSIYISDSGYYGAWESLITNEGITIYDAGNDPWTLVAQFADQVNGYIIYRNDSAGAPPSGSVTSSDTLKYKHVDESYVVAVSLASIFNAVAVAEQDVPKLQAAGITNEIMNVVGKDTEWLFNSTYFDMLRKDLVFEVEHHSSRRFFLIDYAVFAGAPVWHADSIEQREEFLKEFDADSPSFGWGAVADAVLDEGKLNTQTSVAGAFHIPSDWCKDLSVFAAIQVPIHQKLIPPVNLEENVHYVTILLSDGDNLQWMMSDYSGPQWFGNENRGEFAMGWMIPPAMADLAPLILREYYNNASSGDRFVAGNSGNGVLYPTRCHWTNIHMNRSTGLFERADITSVVIQDWGWHEKSFQDVAQLEGIQGIFYNDYQLYDLQSGKIMWVNDKPAISMTYNYWITAGQEANVISRKINRASRNINSFNAYSVIVVHAWSHDLDDISNMVSNFEDDVRVVDPDSFLELLSNNIVHRNINFGKITKIFIIIGSIVAVSVSLVIIRIIRKKRGKERLLILFSRKIFKSKNNISRDS